MGLDKLYKLLLQQEIGEAKFKFERLLQFHGKPEQQLIVREVEGSLVTRSPDADQVFLPFNVARIQETSASGVQEVVRVLSGEKHILVTAPLGLSEASFLGLQSQGYGVFHHRSVLGLRIGHLEIVTEKRLTKVDRNCHKPCGQVCHLLFALLLKFFRC